MILVEIVLVFIWCVIGYSSCLVIYLKSPKEVGEFLRYNPAFVAFLGLLGPLGLGFILIRKILLWKSK